MKKQVLEILQKQHGFYVNRYLVTLDSEFLYKTRALWEVIEQVEKLPDDDWIEVGIRLADADEAEMYDCSTVITGEMPEEGRILTTYCDGSVGIEDFCIEGDEFFFVSGYKAGEDNIAWKPFPEPFRKE